MPKLYAVKDEAETNPTQGVPDTKEELTPDDLKPKDPDGPDGPDDPNAESLDLVLGEFWVEGLRLVDRKKGVSLLTLRDPQGNATDLLIQGESAFHSMRFSIGEVVRLTIQQLDTVPHEGCASETDCPDKECEGGTKQEWQRILNDDD